MRSVLGAIACAAVLAAGASVTAEPVKGFWDASTQPGNIKFGHVGQGIYFPIWFTCDGRGMVVNVEMSGSAKASRNARSAEFVVTIGGARFVHKGTFYSGVDDGYGYSRRQSPAALAPLLDAMAAGGDLTMRVRGGAQSHDVALSGAARPLAAFRQACEK
jgi:hypothetical protein